MPGYAQRVANTLHLRRNSKEEDEPSELNQQKEDDSVGQARASPPPASLLAPAGPVVDAVKSLPGVQQQVTLQRNRGIS
jgi:hypothetical protein